jgi:hypothetical protein
MFQFNKYCAEEERLLEANFLIIFKRMPLRFAEWVLWMAVSYHICMVTVIVFMNDY